MQTEEPAVDWYLPASQLSHAVLTPAAALNVPAPQLSHAVLTPAAALNVPAPQLVQFAAPANEYVPATQSSQDVALVQELLTPALALYFPATQSSQAVLTPCVALYLPASQYSQLSQSE
jgi:hypothetical protein